MTGDYAETVRVFESAAVGFPRSDYRPSYLYWAGRAHARLGQGTQSESRLRLVYTDYANSYYGRLAERQLARRGDVLPIAAMYGWHRRRSHRRRRRSSRSRPSR